MAYHFGLIGLGVMGRNFALNVAEKGFSVAGFDLNYDASRAFEDEGKAFRVKGFTDLEDFVDLLDSPKKIMMLVPAGKPVDELITQLIPHLQTGDLLIDGGNSFYKDTDRRFQMLTNKGIHYLGMGVSGGAEGARKGPSMMPGGSPEAYQLVRPIMEAASAKVGGQPCVTYIGSGSAGNYVKMVHNGIEYALMQLISEVYQILKAIGWDNVRMSDLFGKWNNGRLQSFLIEITRDILLQKDDLTSGYLVDMILDKGKQKGTGKWTSQHAFDLGVPTPGIDTAVIIRGISSFTSLRDTGAHLFSRNSHVDEYPETLLEDLEKAVYTGFVLNFAQGFHLIQAANEAFKYGIELEKVATIWRGGCIIRTSLLEDIRRAFIDTPDNSVIFFSDTMKDSVAEAVDGLRKTLLFSLENKITLPVLSSSYQYFLSITSHRTPVNLIQAQRDYFGAHTYERIDRPGIFHTEWDKN